MEVAISVVLVVAFIGFIVWRMKKNKADGTGEGFGGGAGGTPIGERPDQVDQK